MKKKVTQKTTKKSAKKPLLESMTLENKVDYTLVIAEEMRDSIQAVVENIGGLWKEVIALRTKTDAIFEETGRIRMEVGDVKVRLASVENRLTRLERNSDVAQDDLRLIKSDIAEIKKTITAKADIKYISLFEARVARIEKKLA